VDSQPAQIAATDYCRRARRLRSTFAGQPSRLHRALAELSKPVATPGVNNASTTPAPASIERVTVCPSALLGVRPDQELAVRRFVEHVRGSISARSVTGRDIGRHSLLRVADGLQIGRFHANLVIAAILHETPPEPAMPRADRPRTGKWPLLATLVATQATLIGALTLVWHWIA
jgi:hypothetical protein